MKTTLLRRFYQDPEAVNMVSCSVDAIHTDSRTAGFLVGYPITVSRGQRLVITTTGVWIEEYDEPYQDENEDV